VAALGAVTAAETDWEAEAKDLEAEATVEVWWEVVGWAVPEG